MCHSLTGELPLSGKVLDTLGMPWKFYGRMTDAELSAVHKYLTSLD